MLGHDLKLSQIIMAAGFQYVSIDFSLGIYFILNNIKIKSQTPVSDSSYLSYTVTKNIAWTGYAS